MRIGLAHDYLLVLRGAERAFAAVSDIWPGAPIHTLLYDDEGTHGRFHDRKVLPSWLQRCGIRQDGFRRLLPVYPEVVRRLPVAEYDVVVSSSTAFAHGIRPRKGAVHVCYCHSPFRYAWHDRERARAEVRPVFRPALDVALRRHRRFDRVAAKAVTTFISSSETGKERIRRYWNRESIVIHPPVEIERFAVSQPEDYYLLVGELVAHKRFDVALEAGLRARRRVVVVGGGPELGRLRERYGRSAEFVGRVDDSALATLYARAAALVMPNVEEFGITAVEAQAAGRPVIGVNAGGARETVVHGKTGWLVPPDDLDALTHALRSDYHEGRLAPPAEIQQHAQRFSKTVFQQRMRAAVDEAASGLA
jgi:glycosyltransferase involved in cell wall biosynthesis